MLVYDGGSSGSSSCGDKHTHEQEAKSGRQATLFFPWTSLYLGHPVENAPTVRDGLLPQLILFGNVLRDPPRHVLVLFLPDPIRLRTQINYQVSMSTIFSDLICVATLMPFHKDRFPAQSSLQPTGPPCLFCISSWLFQAIYCCVPNDSVA